MDKRKYLKAILRGLQYTMHKFRVYDARGGKITAEIKKEVYLQAKARGVDVIEPQPTQIKGDDVTLIREREIEGDEDLCIYMVVTSDDVARVKRNLLVQ